MDVDVFIRFSDSIRKARGCLSRKLDSYPPGEAPAETNALHSDSGPHTFSALERDIDAYAQTGEEDLHEQLHFMPDTPFMSALHNNDDSFMLGFTGLNVLNTL
jgi:hypothetical protein